MTGRTIYLMRHGAPTLPRRMLGRTDCDATDDGIAACREQAQSLAVTRLISSDLKRAVQCAAAVSSDLRVPYEIDPRWRELDFGEWDGLPGSAIDPDALGGFWADPDGCPPPRGERWSGLVGRVSSAIDAMPEEPALVVTHGGAMRAALHALCGFAQPQLWTIDLPYACVLGLRIWPGSERTGQIIGLWP